RRLFGVTPDMIDVYSRLTGVPYPWAKYAQTTVADFFGGMENVSATTLVDWLPDERAYVDRPWYQWILIPHELAHQWFGDYVTTANWAIMWLNEGFAEFMPGQYWGAKLGRHAEEDYYLDEYRQYLQIDARRRMPLAALGSNNIYPKGALVLRMLRDYLGPERFWASLHTYLTGHALGNATSDDLRQAVLDATGENLDGFWSEWVYGAGHPAFTVTAAYDTAARTLALGVKQTQSDSATGDSTGPRYRTAAVFHMPLSIRVGTSAGDVVRRERPGRARAGRHLRRLLPDPRPGGGGAGAIPRGGRRGTARHRPAGHRGGGATRGRRGPGRGRRCARGRAGAYDMADRPELRGAGRRPHRPRCRRFERA